MAKTINQLLASPIPATLYHAYPILPVKGVCIIGAQSKTFKSFLALNIAYDLAEGREDGVLGRWSCNKKPKTILYLEQELGEYRLRDRIEPIHKYRESAVAGANLFYASKDLVCKLDTTDGLRRIRDHIKSCGPDVLILDPLVWFHSQDENDNTRMQGIMETIFGLQEEFGHSTIVVHHMSKPSETRSGDDPNSLRGASSVFAACDTVISLSKPVSTEKEVIRLKFVCRSTENPPPFDLQLDPATKIFRPYR